MGVNGDRDAALRQVQQVARALRDAVETVIEGKREVIHLALTALLAEGHLLVEDVPGVGKTMLAKSLAAAMGGTVRRIQFTPDLLPTDITGVSVFQQHTGAFVFRPGGVFANVVIGDEINRASPKTQSALLEAMEEQHVTVDGTTHALPSPFLVVATQNPIEMEGTYPLPEAQRDRFMMRISMGYPTQAAEAQMLDRHGSADPLARLRPVTDPGTVKAAITAAATLHVGQEVKDYLVAVVAATRRPGDLRLGASPRASLHLLRAARVHAALRGRDYVIPEDVKDLAEPVLAHRVLLTPTAQLGRVTPGQAIAAAVASVPLRA